jgi:hypothetical protein
MVQRPQFNFTRAITIHARPEEIWSWLVVDWISRAGKPRPTTAMRVKAFEPNQWLLWEHQGCPWV